VLTLHRPDRSKLAKQLISLTREAPFHPRIQFAALLRRREITANTPIVAASNEITSIFWASSSLLPRFSTYFKRRATQTLKPSAAAEAAEAPVATVFTLARLLGLAAICLG
jgi:hypothetical protein